MMLSFFFFKWKSSMDFLLQTKERAWTVITGQESNSHGIMTSSFMSINKTLPGLPSERSCVKNVLGQSHPGSTPSYLSWSWQILDTDTQNICIPGLHFPENLLPGGWSRIQEYLFCNSLYDSPECKTPFPVGQFSSLQSLSRVQLFATPWIAARQASLSMTNSWSPPKPMSIESVMPSNHLILCHPLLLLPSIFPSIWVFSNESALRIRWPKYWSFSFNISRSNEHPGLISFRMDWLDLLAVQGTLKSLLLHHSSKASILQCSAFFIVQLSHPYMTIGKTIALTRWTFVDKVMSLLFNMLSRLVITFLPRSKRLLISLLHSPSAVILEPRKIKSATVSAFSPSICHEVMGLDAIILVFWMLSSKPTFSLSSFTFIKRLFSSSLLHCHKGGIICISEVIVISPSNLDSSLCFFQPSIPHDVLYI